MNPIDLELTSAAAKMFKNGHGLEAFAKAKQLKRRAQNKADVQKVHVRLTHKGEVLYTAKPKE